MVVVLRSLFFNEIGVTLPKLFLGLCSLSLLLENIRKPMVYRKGILVENGLPLPILIPDEEKKLTSFLFSHFFVVPKKILRRP